MSTSSYQFMFIRLLFSLSLLLPLLTVSFSSLQPLCHEDESSALLQFKESFTINNSASIDPRSYPKVSSWKQEGDSTSDCCSWDGVECDQHTGHVIGLDLGRSRLIGSINSNSTLFRLVHLQKLNLAYNNFNHSRIPSTVGNLSRLTYLNLSYSVFSGQIPSEISRLSKLSVLSLSSHDYLYTESLARLVLNLTSLEQLLLSYVNISSPIPEILTNFSSLKTLDLYGCGLYGEFPTKIFQLPNLQHLIVALNQQLTGHFPEFHSSTPLKMLQLDETSFFGKLPASIRNLNSLHYLGVFNCNISGPIPSSLDNLTQLTSLDLSYNNILGPIPSSFGNLTQLTVMDLSYNNLSGTVELEMVLKVKSLRKLILSYNKLSLLINKTSSNATFPQFRTLRLDSCNLNEFPDFLRNQHKLHWLGLSENNLQGLIPSWIYQTSIQALRVLVLSNNFLTGFERSPIFLPWPHLENFWLRYNMLQGSLPIPPPSIKVYDVQRNELTGEISPLICNLSSLYEIDLSYNKLSGKLPPCLGNFGSSLSLLQLRGNNFHGTIPDTWESRSNLKMVDFSENQLEGQMPRSLANCRMLEFLNVGNNKINDTFPFWLGNLPQLQVLILRSNGFHGAISSPKTNYTFPMLRIIDLSHNGFFGKLPSGYFLLWNAMKIVDARQLTYMQLILKGDGWNTIFPYSVTITNKGILLEYNKIQDFLMVIDLSSNKFEGAIPRFIGNLKALNLFNLSNNVLTGPIPLSLGNLTYLESLDLSHNKLSGEIPPQLTQLTFLAVFNVSHNYLEGPIPHGKQFDTFLNTSFEGNLGLCGSPLSNKCENFKDLPPSPSTFEENQGSESPFEFGWKVVVIGYGCGLVVGVVIGQIVVTRKQDWFMKTFAIGQQKRRKVNRRVRRN